MSIFSDITLEWDGEEYTIPAARMMRLVQAVEDVVTLPELQDCIARMKAARIASAYAVMLRFAGVRVSDEEVYEKVFDSEDNMHQILSDAGTLLYQIICPPKAFQAGKKKTAKKKASKKKARRKAS